MKYNFTDIIDRENKDAVAIDVIPIPGAEIQPGFDRIPMWVADMNFATAPSVQKAMLDRIAHPCFGYFGPSKEYLDAIIRWQESRHGTVGLTPENIGYENGVLGGVVSALNTFCVRVATVLLHSPTYIGFSHVLEENGYQAVHSPLKKDEQGVWRMDYEDMEEKLSQEDIRCVILCSPHNPCGRVWERWELEKAAALFEKYEVSVISDEIWADIVLDNNKHIPTQQVSDYVKQNSVALYAITKTFNLAGLVGSYRIVYNKKLHARLKKEINLSHYNGMNVLSMHALVGAYSAEGEEWADELLQVLSTNAKVACDFIEANFPGVTVSRPEGTYMLFLDCTEWCEKHGKTLDELLKAGVGVGVIWQDGRAFFGPCHIRMNLALPTARVEEAFRRLKEYVFVD
ncbi:MAG: aminotransferase class I/II-fold pyridoxal phosphate-dependent enzyme [Oscillospiraceae bacterium]|nr:aminotransferase class I/II-fold pyridoxal phosphate-dependent enzyme [Oscillospiraceae bacterium]